MILDRAENANPDAQATDADARATDRWLTPGRFGVMLGALIVATFPRVLAGGKSFFYRDFGVFTYPLAFFHRESFWRGEMPLWNPYNACGLPFLAQWNTMTLYPGSLIYLLLPLPWSLCFFGLAHMFLAGMGAYFLALRWTGSRLGASVGGLAFGFNGLSWYALMWTNNTAALGWMPWVVLAVERAWCEGGARRIALAALAGAMQMLSGAPEVILLTWSAVGALWLSHFLTSDAARLRIFGRSVLVGLLVAGLAAAQLLPFLDLLRHSQRDTGFGDAQWAMPLNGLANYLVPRFHVIIGPYNPPSQRDQFWTSSYYLSMGVIALALLAIWRMRSRRIWVLAALAVFSILMALGNNGPAYAVLRRVVPQIGFMRFPIKFVVLATFALPFLAAHAVAWLQSRPIERWRAERNWFVVIGSILVIAIVAIATYASIFSTAPDEAGATWLNALSRAGFLAFTCACLLLLCRPMRSDSAESVAAAASARRNREWLWVGVVLLSWLDVATHARSLTPTVSNSVYATDSIRQYYKWGDQLRPGVSRAMLNIPLLDKVTFHSVESPENDFSGRRLALFADCNMLDHAAKVDGFYSLYLREQSALNLQLYTGTNGLEPLKDFLGVSWLSKPSYPHETEWLQRDTFMPMITAGQEPIFTNSSATLQRVTSPEFEPRKIVYLPAEARGVVVAKAQPAAKVISREVGAKQINAEVESPAEAMVVVAQAFYHPWHAYVDGKRVPLWRANYGFQALEVPAGRHHVKLVYEDVALWAGAVVSVITLAGCLVAVCRRTKGKTV